MSKWICHFVLLYFAFLKYLHEFIPESGIFLVDKLGVGDFYQVSKALKFFLFKRILQRSKSVVITTVCVVGLSSQATGSEKRRDILSFPDEIHFQLANSGLFQRLLSLISPTVKITCLHSNSDCAEGVQNTQCPSSLTGYIPSPPSDANQLSVFQETFLSTLL